jgi:hypothetical protein
MPPPPTPAGGKTVHILSPPSVDMFETFSGNYSTLQVRVCLQNVVCVCNFRRCSPYRCRCARATALTDALAPYVIAGVF